MTVESPATKVVYGTFRTISGSHDKNGNFKTQYDSGEKFYEKRVPSDDPRGTAEWLSELVSDGLPDDQDGE